METQQSIRVLVVDDEKAIRRFLQVALNAQGWVVDEASTGAEAMTTVVTTKPGAILLDLGLPDMDGKSIITRIREWTDVPIVVLSVRDNEAEKIAALDAGADDYVTKPFSVGELMARLRAAIRRHTLLDSSEPVLRAGDLELDISRHIVTLRGAEVQLTPTEYDLLRIFMQNTGKVLTHRYLLAQVWGPAYKDQTHLLQVNISNLRRKVELDATRPTHIVTEPGVGYRMRG